MQVKYNMVVDFARPTKSNTIIVSENDAGTRVCNFTLLSNKQPMDMQDVITATVKAIKSNGSIVYGDATILTDEEEKKLNQLTYTIPAEMTSEAGITTITITLNSDEGATITSFEFYLSVRNSLYSEDDYIGDDEAAGFRDLLNRCQTALARFEQMTREDALPCPYPLNINVDGGLKAYSGNELVEIELGNLVRFRRIGGEE